VDAQQIILLLMNVVGGAAVIGSYVLWLRGSSGGANALWGRVPAGLRPVYTISMILSAIGYLAVFYYLLFEAGADEVRISGELGFVWFIPIVVLMLFPSALWMPLSSLYVDRPSTVIWIAVRTVLFVVGLASIALAWALLALEPNDGNAAYWIAAVGSCYFAFHTFVLDALLWAALFRRRS
jgi:uncharacterized membrane protein